MIVLGIDPGFAIVGYGAVHAVNTRYTALSYGVIRTEAGKPFDERLKEIFSDMNELIEKLRPDALSIEELFFNTNRTTAINVAEARGVIVLAAALKSLPVYEYTPLQVKQSVVGYGRAEKKQVMEMTRALLALKASPKVDDAADALALALCHAQSASSGLFGLQ